MVRRKMMWSIGFLLLLVSVAWGAAVMSVQVRNGQLRSNPSFLGQIVAPVGYGEQLFLLRQQGDWWQVQNTRAQKGWIHQSALTKKKIKLSSGGQAARSGASGEEIALAGKGFNSDVEAQFRMNHSEVDFTWVDRMEMIRISPEEMRQFLIQGDVRSAGGAS